MANIVYGFTVLTGGGDGALDKIDGTVLVDGDPAFGVVDGVFHAFKVNATSGAEADGVNIIAPATNAGDKRWIAQTIGITIEEIVAMAMIFG